MHVGEASYVLMYAGVGYHLGGAWDDNLSLLVNGSTVLIVRAHHSSDSGATIQKKNEAGIIVVD